MAAFFRRHVLSLALAIALVGSLTANFVTTQRSQQYFQAYQQVVLDPMGKDYYLPRDKPEVPQGKKLVVFFGDSRASAWPAPASTDRFFFVNRGVPGQSSGQVLERFADDVAPLNPNIIVIQVGINDLTTIPYFESRQGRIIKNCKENIQALVEQSLELEATVILTTIFPIGKSTLPWQFASAVKVAKAVEEVNQFIYSLASDNVLVMDTGVVLFDDNGYAKSIYNLDSLHLNAHGYQVLNSVLLTFLEGL